MAAQESLSFCSFLHCILDGKQQAQDIDGWMQVNLVVEWSATLLFSLTKIVESVQFVEALLELLTITPAGAHLLEWS